MASVILAADIEGTHSLPSIRKHLQAYNHTFQELPTNQSDDALYNILAREVLNIQSPKLAILLSGSGVKANIQLNLHKGIVGSLCHNEFVTTMTRQHNDSNVMVVPTHCLGNEYIKTLVDIYLREKFDGEASHAESNEAVKALGEKHLKSE